ncbi:hypothetical protein DL96DRAFT_1115101 [Flagelloscypha sp. PMI_526]|nr:hypothetical protein DL96DRAFT_1115101 [Flagelloscypha sp. PMI_526]
MPSYNITIDDTSPMIRYEGAWKDAGTNGTDPMQPRYANQTFHATQSVSSRAILKFNGTAVYIYGARRFNHGQFTVDVDGETESLDGKADPDEFQQVLYSKTGLSPNQEHEVTLTNGINPDYVDIDFIVATLGDGQEGRMAQVEQFDDTTPKIGYSGNWEVNGPSQFIIQAFNASYRATKDPSGFLTLPFSGNSIRVYGGTGRNHGPYSVTLDGGQAQVYNGSTPSDVVYRGQQLLYLASNLPAGNHSLTLSNLGPQGSYVDIDYYVQETWPSSQTSSGPQCLEP